MKTTLKTKDAGCCITSEMTQEASALVFIGCSAPTMQIIGYKDAFELSDFFKLLGNTLQQRQLEMNMGLEMSGRSSSHAAL